MTRKIYFLDRAVDDIKEAYGWYEEQQSGLGKRFGEAVLETVAEISKFPFAFPNKFKNSRETIIPGFPYVIIYRFTGTAIFVQAVFPARMNPRKKY